MSQSRKTRPCYEDYGVSRRQIERDWDQWVSWGDIGSPEYEAELIEQACKAMHFVGAPKDSWTHIARELRIIWFQLPELKTESSMSRTQMAKRCSSYADQLWEIARDMSEMAWQEDFTIAALAAKKDLGNGDKFEYVNLSNNVMELIAPFRTLARWMKASGEHQSHKIRPASERERRLVLACKLLPVFTDQFAIEPKLKGGSASRPIEEESPWAQFYQAAASLALGEKATPDRQRILLDVRLPIK